MVPIRGEWTPFADINDQLNHYRLWGLISPKSKQLRPVMVIDGRGNAPEPCNVVGYQGENWAVIELDDGYHAIYGEYLADMQPPARQRIPNGMCLAEVLAKYVVFDIETTGFSRENDRIIEIAAITYENGKRISVFHSMVNPERLIPKEIVELTGITQEDVENAPTISDTEESFLQYIGDNPIVGHNAASFDLPFLLAQFVHPIDNVLIDTLPIARDAFSMLPSHKLEYLNDVLNLQSAGSHRALNDVETTNALLWACLAPEKYEMLVNKALLDERLCPHKPERKKKSEPKKPAPARSTKGPNFDGFKNYKKVDITSITPSCSCNGSPSPLCGKTIVFTGTLTIPREEAMQMAVNAGAILQNKVSSRTGYLVVGKQDVAIVGMDGMSTKEEKAHALNEAGKANIQIISESEFLELVKKEGATV